MTKEELKKENAELKEELNYAKSHCLFNSDCPTQKENAELKAQLESERDLPAIAYMQGAEKQKKKDADQLTKAKEFLKKFMPYVIESYLKQDISNIKLSFSEIEEAEQFLSEVEK